MAVLKIKITPTYPDIFFLFDIVIMCLASFDTLDLKQILASKSVTT